MSEAEIRRNIWDRAANTWRRLVDSATVAWDTSTPGQASASVPNGGIGSGQLADGAATNAKLADMAQSTIKGRAAGAGTGDPQDLTATEVIAIIGARTQGKTTLWVPALDNLMIARTGAPAFGTVSTGSSIKYRTLDFDPNSTESAIFSVAMPKGWNEGTMTFVPVWSHGATITNFGVDWQLRGQAISDGDSGDFTPAGQQGSVDIGGTTDTIYQGPESSTITIQGTPANNDLVVFEIFRNVNGAGDTLAVDARLHGIKLFFTTDAPNDA